MTHKFSNVLYIERRIDVKLVKLNEVNLSFSFIRFDNHSLAVGYFFKSWIPTRENICYGFP